MDESRQKGEYHESGPKCSRCGRSEHDAALFAVRMNGLNTWVCAKCLPSLIHG